MIPTMEDPAVSRGWALRKGRVSIPLQAYLVTTVCHSRSPFFAQSEIADLVVTVLNADECWPSAEAHAWVLMPDHWHGLIQIEGRESIGAVVQRAKSLVTKSLRSHFATTVQVWQKGFHDHALRREEAINDVLRYLLANPVRAGLVDHWHEWPYRGGSMVHNLSADASLL